MAETEQVGACLAYLHYTAVFVFVYMGWDVLSIECLFMGSNQATDRLWST